jgi:hypothetical protein
VLGAINYHGSETTADEALISDFNESSQNVFVLHILPNTYDQA